MASKITISNQGLLLLGASQITGFNDGSVNAEAIKLIYDDTRDSLLRTYPWRFATKRSQLTADVTAPVFGRARSFPLPGDYLAPLAPYPEDNFEQLDWIIEANSKLLTDDSSPLDFRYIAKIEDPDCMDPLFRKALSARLAVELAEQLTQSSSKLQNVAAIFDRTIGEARQLNAFEAVNHQPPLDEWITARQRGRDNTRNWH